MLNAREALQMAGRLCQAGRVADAVEVCKEAARRFPPDSALLNTLGLCYFSLRQAGPAAHVFEQAIAVSPNAAHLHHNLGLALQMQDRWPDALVAYRRATELAPGDEPAYVKLAGLLMSHGLAEEADARLTAGLVHLPNSVRLWLLLANARVGRRDPAGAEEAYRRALELSPEAANPYGFWLQVEGRFAESFEMFERSITDEPKQGMAYYALLDHKVSPEVAASRLAQMEPITADPSLPDEERLYLFYALGKAYDQTGDYERAMQSFDRANEVAFKLHNEGRPFDRVHFREVNDITMRAFDAARLAARRSEGSVSRRPIFIVGMIRSGTTLVEQILSSHRDVGAAGELRFWMDEPVRHYPYDRLDRTEIEDMASRYLAELDKADGSRPFVTDKMPLNYANLGLMHSVFPHAKIVHVRRNPVDTCLSIYSTYFGSGPNFPYRRQNIVFAYKEYLRLMANWRSVIPSEELVEVDYEELVSGPEPAIRRLVDALGLPWDDACLRHETNLGTVNTPSRWQVRQPMYTTSTERWRRYEPWLGEFAKLLPTVRESAPAET